MEPARNRGNDSAERMANRFEPPLHLINDLVYCQQALETHFHMHRLVHSSAGKRKLAFPEQIKRVLLDLEEQIREIGMEQKYIFNSLRFSIDVHTLNAGPDSQARLLITQAISRQIAEFVQTERDIQPKDAKPRMTMAELYNKYVVGSDISAIVVNQPEQVASIVGVDLTTQPSTSQSIPSQAGPSDSNELPNATDKVKPMTKILEVNVHNRFVNIPGQSLLRPRKQWAKPTNGVPSLSNANSSVTEKPAASIQISRLKLTAALSKAASGPQTEPSATNDDELDDLSGSADLSNQSDSMEPPSKRHRNSMDNGEMSTRPPSSTSVSSNGSIASGETDAALASEAINSASSIQELSQEHFLQCFRLCTPEHKALLLAKKPVRRRRNCTSEEARQIYKEKYALFERQYTVRRNKKEFMYSPPATRGRRRVVSNDKLVAKSAATKPVTAKPAAGKKKRKPKAKRAQNGNRRSKTTSESSESSNPSNTSNSTSTSNSSTNANANSVVPITVPIVAAAITAITAATAKAAVIVQAKENKVCLKCYKRNNLLACSKCDGRYHASCHTSDIENNIRQIICPDCCRPKVNIDQSKRTYIHTYGK